MAAELAVYVSGHGYGHATRSRAWLAARAPELAIRLRSEAPPALLDAGALGLHCDPAPVDPGVVQPNSLDVDLDASLEAHQRLAADWERAVAAEAARLSEGGARLVVGDVPPLAFAAAERAGLPALAVANFSWDWILADFAVGDARWRPIAERYGRAYARATLLRLPLACPMPAFAAERDVPLLVNVSQRPREQCRRALGLSADEGRRVVLVSFGGLGGIAAGRDGSGEDLSDYLFVCCDGRPLLRDAAWLAAKTSAALPHEDVVHACDAVIGKPGYGIAAEALAHGTRSLCLPRPGFPEAGPLFAELSRRGCARELPREDYAAGRWGRHLDALFAAPPPEPWPDCGGAPAVAEAILERL